MIKILAIRIILTAGLVCLGACATPGKTTEKDQGPVSAYARNALAAENPEGLIRVGEGFERAGDYPAAYNLYAQALAAAPGLVTAQLAVARIQIRLGQQAEGLERLMTLTAAHPDNMNIRRELVSAHILTGAYDAAAALMPALIAAKPDDADLADLDGRLAEIQGDSAHARASYDRALYLSPNNPLITQHLAMSFALAGNFDTGVALLQRTMDRADTQNAGKRSLAMIYALSGQTEAAIVIAQSAMPPEQAKSMRLFYKLLPTMTRSEQAAAMLFDRVPTDILVRDRDGVSK